jgi:hypothetical protein
MRGERATLGDDCATGTRTGVDRRATDDRRRTGDASHTRWIDDANGRADTRSAILNTTERSCHASVATTPVVNADFVRDAKNESHVLLHPELVAQTSLAIPTDDCKISSGIDVAEAAHRLARAASELSAGDDTHPRVDVCTKLGHVVVGASRRTKRRYEETMHAGADPVLE